MFKQLKETYRNLTQSIRKYQYTKKRLRILLQEQKRSRNGVTRASQMLKKLIQKKSEQLIKPQTTQSENNIFLKRKVINLAQKIIFDRQNAKDKKKQSYLKRRMEIKRNNQKIRKAKQLDIRKKYWSKLKTNQELELGKLKVQSIKKEKIERVYQNNYQRLKFNKTSIKNFNNKIDLLKKLQIQLQNQVKNNQDQKIGFKKAYRSAFLLKPFQLFNVSTQQTPFITQLHNE